MQKKYTLTISASFDELENIQDLTEKIIKEHNIGEDLGNGFSLVLSEACSNAIKHGSNFDESMSVHIAVEITAELLKISVRDEGPGFNPADVPDPLAPENLLKPSGRGVYLMKEYADNVSYNEQGNEIRIEFQRPEK